MYPVPRWLPPHLQLEITEGSIDLPGGHLGFVRPRDASALPNEEDAGAGLAYPPHWAQLWPSGVELARAVSAHDWGGAAVLELGCGLGLPAVAAALGGADVAATDRSVNAVAFAAVNAARNGVAMRTAVCAWADPGPLVAGAPWRLVLAADVLYGQRNVDELLALLPQLVDGGGAVWIADPQRPLTEEFLAAARATWSAVDSVATGDPDIRIHRLSGPPS
jgi:predicted nicotinamide N-methyase